MSGIKLSRHRVYLLGLSVLVHALQLNCLKSQYTCVSQTFMQRFDGLLLPQLALSAVGLLS